MAECDCSIKYKCQDNDLETVEKLARVFLGDSKINDVIVILPNDDHCYTILGNAQKCPIHKLMIAFGFTSEGKVVYKIQKNES